MNFWEPINAEDRPLSVELVASRFFGCDSAAPSHPGTYDPDCPFSHEPTKFDYLVWNTYDWCVSLQELGLDWHTPLEAAALSYRHQQGLAEWDATSEIRTPRIRAVISIARHVLHKYPETLTDLWRFVCSSGNSWSRTKGTFDPVLARKFISLLLSVFENWPDQNSRAREADAVIRSSSNAIDLLNSGDRRPFTTASRKRGADGETRIPTLDDQLFEIRTELVMLQSATSTLGMKNDDFGKLILNGNEQFDGFWFKRASRDPLATLKSTLKNHAAKLRKNTDPLAEPGEEFTHLDRMRLTAKELVEGGLDHASLLARVAFAVSEHNRISLILDVG